MKKFIKELTLGKILKVSAIIFIMFVAVKILVITCLWFERRPFILLGFIISWAVATMDE